MSKFAKFLVGKWRDNGIYRWAEAVEGTYYSTLTGSDPPNVEIDWQELEK